MMMMMVMSPLLSLLLLFVIMTMMTTTVTAARFILSSSSSSSTTMTSSTSFSSSDSYHSHQQQLPCQKIPVTCLQLLPRIPPMTFEGYCAFPQLSPWRSRQAVASSWIWDMNPQFVLDLGAGCFDLQTFISTDTVYIPDEVNRGGCDYNIALPQISDAQKRLRGVVVALGVIEYLCDPLSFLVALKNYNQDVILSYAFVSDPSTIPVPPRVNAMTSQQWDELLKKSGWKSPTRHARVFTDISSNSLFYFPRPTYGLVDDEMIEKNI